MDMNFAAVLSIVGGIMASLGLICSAGYFLWRTAQAVGRMEQNLLDLTDAIKDLKGVNSRVSVLEARFENHLTEHKYFRNERSER